MMKPKPKSIQCSGSVHFDTSGWLHYWRLSFEKNYQNCFNTRSFGCLKAAVSLTVNLSSVVSHLQSVRGCVHVFASWLPAHDWEVTVQLLRAGPDCQALLDTAPHQALYSLLSLCLLSGPWLDPLPCDTWYPHTRRPWIFKLSTWRVGGKRRIEHFYLLDLL